MYVLSFFIQVHNDFICVIDIFFSDSRGRLSLQLPLLFLLYVCMSVFISDKLSEFAELYSLSDCAYYKTEKEQPHEIVIRLAYNLESCIV